LSKRVGRKQFRFGDRLGLGASGRCQWIANFENSAIDFLLTKHDVRDRSRADVARWSIPRAVARFECHTGRRKASEIIVAESQMCASVVIDLGYEVLIALTAIQQVRARLP